MDQATNMKLEVVLIKVSDVDRAKILTATGGCSRRSRRDFPDANGNRKRPTWQLLQSCFTKRPSTTTTSRRCMASIIGGIGTRLT